MSTQRLTCSQALLRFLQAQQSEQLDGSIAPLFGGVWGIFGHGNVAGIGEALWQERESLRYLRGHNEQSMAHSAVAFAKATAARRCMAVTSSIGPGATNLVTAAALAHTNRLPMLLLPGDIYASRRPDPVLQQLEDPSYPLASVNDCLRPVSRYFDRLMRPEQLIDTLPKAIETLLDAQRRGPVTLALPQDVQAEVYDYPNWLFEETLHRPRRLQPDPAELRQARALLLQAERPLIIAGGGVVYSGAEAELLRFAERYGIPVAETQAGKGAFPASHPLHAGAIGVTGTRLANETAREADLLLCIATRLSDFTTASKSLFPQAKLIGVNTDSLDALKGRALPLIGDARAVLSVLEAKTVDPAHQQRFQQRREAWLQERREIMTGSQQLPSDAEVLGVLNARADAESTVVCAAGGLPGELHKIWHCESAAAYHVEYAYSCMGYEIAAGVGIKLAQPQRKVTVVVGDGSYLMMHCALLTAVQLELDLDIVVLDNHGFGCINRLQQACGSPPFGNLFGRSQVDFVQNASSYGCHAEKAVNLDQLSQRLANTSQGVRVYVIETDAQRSSPGYAWWDVAVAAKSEESGVRHAHEAYQTQLQELSHAH